MRKRPDLLPEGAASRRVELEPWRIGGKQLPQPADAIARRAREALDADGGDRGAWLACPGRRALRRAPTGYARCRKLRRACRAQRHIASIAVWSGSPRQSKVRVSRGAGSTFMVTSVMTRERAPGAGHRLAEIVAGDVLHHPPAGFEDLAPAIHALDAEHMIAREPRHESGGCRRNWWRRRRRSRIARLAPSAGPRSIGSKASCWPCSARTCSISAKRRSGAAQRTSSDGS